MTTPQDYRQHLIDGAVRRADRLIQMGAIYRVPIYRAPGQEFPIRVIADAPSGARLTVYITARYGTHDRRVTTLQAETQANLGTAPVELKPSKIPGWFQANATQAPFLKREL